MNYFISTTTIENAYNTLINNEIDNESIFLTFFILKACDINNIGYKSVSVISEKAFIPARNLCGLFLPTETQPPRYDFISPFSMKQWGTQPSELLKKWVNSRIKNNVIGGATTWRRIIDYDPINSEIKFKYNYLEEIIELTIKNNKINLFALSIWANRFYGFPKKLTLIEISNLFKKQFNINEKEEHSLFRKEFANLTIAFDDSMHDAFLIRNLIGKPADAAATWLTSTKITGTSTGVILQQEEIIMSDFQDNRTSDETIKELLNINYQLILSGPPGTSKSYIADKISKETVESKNITRIQFHPKYSYHDFIGGYVVEGSEVLYKLGILPRLSIEAKTRTTENFLLIIDEINRANVGQVFGETIQCLDRNSSTQILVKGELQEFSLPKNLKIIATMNTSDRSIGAIDFAIKRRFTTIYCPPSPDILLELCQNDFEFSFADFLRTINNKLLNTLKNKELAIGHTFFLDNNHIINDKFSWDIQSFELMFNYKILPLIEDFTKGNTSQLIEIIGPNLYKKLSGEDLKSALNSYLNNDN